MGEAGELEARTVTSHHRISYLSEMPVPSFFQHGSLGTPLYERARNDREDHDLVESMWRRFAPVCGDPVASFLRDAQTNFCARLWEMRLACLLLDADLELSRPPRSGPDLCVIIEGRRIWLEATAVDHGTGADAVRRIEGIGSINRDAMILRYTSALEKKRAQHLEFLSRGAVRNDEAFLIAINAGAVQFADVDRNGSYPDIVRSVYPIGPMQFVIPVDVSSGLQQASRPQPHTEHPYRLEIPRMRALAGIPASAFLDDRFGGVSGILFSAADPWNATQRGLILVHNACASVPVPRRRLPAGRDFWHVPTESGFLIDHSDRRSEWPRDAVALPRRWC